MSKDRPLEECKEALQKTETWTNLRSQCEEQERANTVLRHSRSMGEIEKGREKTVTGQALVAIWGWEHENARHTTTTV